MSHGLSPPTDASFLNELPRLFQKVHSLAGFALKVCNTVQMLSLALSGLNRYFPRITVCSTVTVSILHMYSTHLDIKCGTVRLLCEQYWNLLEYYFYTLKCIRRATKFLSQTFSKWQLFGVLYTFNPQFLHDVSATGTRLPGGHKQYCGPLPSSLLLNFPLCKM